MSDYLEFTKNDTSLPPEQVELATGVATTDRHVLIGQKEVRWRLGKISRNTLTNWVNDGFFLPPVKICGLCFWGEVEVQDFVHRLLAERPHDPKTMRIKQLADSLRTTGLEARHVASQITRKSNRRGDAEDSRGTRALKHELSASHAVTERGCQDASKASTSNHRPTGAWNESTHGQEPVRPETGTVSKRVVDRGLDRE